MALGVQEAGFLAITLGTRTGTPGLRATQMALGVQETDFPAITQGTKTGPPELRRPIRIVTARVQEAPGTKESKALVAAEQEVFEPILEHVESTCMAMPRTVTC